MWFPEGILEELLRRRLPNLWITTWNNSCRNLKKNFWEKKSWEYPEERLEKFLKKSQKNYWSNLLRNSWTSSEKLIKESLVENLNNLRRIFCEIRTRILWIISTLIYLGIPGVIPEVLSGSLWKIPTNILAEIAGVMPAEISVRNVWRNPWAMS